MLRFCLLSIMVFSFFGCDRTDPEIKTHSKSLEGRWKLVSVEAKGNPSDRDNSWVYEDGFIDFAYSEHNQLAPMSYSLAEGEIMRVITSLPYKGEILFNTPTPDDYKNGLIALLYNHKIAVLNNSNLTISGTLSLKNAEENYSHYGMSKINFKG